MGAAIARRRRTAHAVLATALAVGLAGCKTADDGGPRASAASAPIGARLAATGGSTVSGLITFRPVEGGVTVAAEVAGLGGSGRYRVAIHATGNCTSPNGFSAGAPVLVANPPAPAAVAFSASTEGTASFVVRMPGIAVDGLAGRSVVVHEGGAGTLEAQPGVRNGRIGCGVIGAIRAPI